MSLIISIEGARKILGEGYEYMSDDEVADLIQNLDAIAVAALRDAREKQISEDAQKLAVFLYDVYQERKQRAE